MSTNYSVLMSVYSKEEAHYLKAAMDSIYRQTIPTNDFVLVCDGPLTNELNKVIEEMEVLFDGILNVYRLEKNIGLGNALNIGLKQCKNELVARMDSDDISLPERVEDQLLLFDKNSDLSIVSGVVKEFQESPHIITGRRMVPKSNQEIVIFSKLRNPFNHPCVMFKKSHIEKVGGYSEQFPLFEDYYLWVRLLLSGCKGENIQEPILLMRVPSKLYQRRGGWNYAKNLLKFNKWMKQNDWIGYKEYFVSVMPHAFVCIMPNILRKLIYQVIHK